MHLTEVWKQFLEVLIFAFLWKFLVLFFQNIQQKLKEIFQSLYDPL